MLKYIRQKFESILNDYDMNKYKGYPSLDDRFKNIESRLRYLETENVCLSNALYESENRLQAQIDKYHPQKIDLSNFELGE